MRDVAAEQQIRRTLAEFSHLTDEGDFAGWVRLFTSGGVFRSGGQEHVGHEALRLFIDEDQPPGRRGMHLTTDSVIRIEGDRAAARSNFLFVASGRDGPVLVASGRYIDVLVSDGGRWLFRKREAVLAGSVTTALWGLPCGA